MIMGVVNPPSSQVVVLDDELDQPLLVSPVGATDPSVTGAPQPGCPVGLQLDKEKESVTGCNVRMWRD